MGMIQDTFRKMKEKKEERKSFESQQRMVEHFEEKKVSHEERLLNQFLEEERQEKIKSALKTFQDRQKHETWSGRKWNPVNAPNMFKGEKNMFSEKSVFLQKSNSKEPKLFAVKQK